MAATDRRRSSTRSSTTVIRKSSCRGTVAAGRHRRVVRGRHPQQEPGRHHPHLERGGGEDVRLLGGGGRGQALLPAGPPRVRRRGVGDPRDTRAGRAAGELRDGTAAQRRHADRGRAKHIPDGGRSGACHGRVGDRPRHHHPQAERAAVGGRARRHLRPGPLRQPGGGRGAGPADGRRNLALRPGHPLAGGRRGRRPPLRRGLAGPRHRRHRV
jgi:hypothetical protein